MENKVLGYKSPLYGRRTAQFKIEPLDYYKCGQVGPDIVMLSYSNGEDVLIFTQGSIGSTYHMDTEDADMKEVPIGNTSGLIIPC